jgi:zinc protease
MPLLHHAGSGVCAGFKNPPYCAPMRRLLTLLLLVLAAVPTVPTVAQEVRVPFTTFELPNGLRVIVHEDHTTPLAAVNVWYHVGSSYEQTGRTGFAHLFEHIMFEGSANVPDGEFERLLEAVGALHDGATSQDRTYYWQTVPSNALALSLWLEADRMGQLLAALDQRNLDVQRDVVKNERRQMYENRPYGGVSEATMPALYPAGHPYSWPVIGSMADLSAATLEDVEAFFRRYYVPNNAVLAVAGDVDPAEVRRLVEQYFGWIPRGEEVRHPEVSLPRIAETRHITLEDRVTLSAVQLTWRTPRAYAPDDAALHALAGILAGGRNSRLYRRLVYDEQIAQEQQLTAYNWSRRLSGDFLLWITARENVELARVERAVLEEIAKLAAAPPTAAELQRVVNGIETRFVRSLESVEGKANQLNAYLYHTGDPGYLPQDLARYRALVPADIQRVAREYLADQERVVISVVPTGRPELAAQGSEASR